MKEKRSVLAAVFAACAMALLILDAKTALSGAREGLALCLQAAIPSLFPFFFLSALLTGTLAGSALPLLRPLGRLCGVPEGAESLLAVGFLGGYPTGAACVAQAYQSGRLNRRDAERMLGFCSNAGPAFLFGLTAGCFSTPAAPWVLWGIHIAAALLTASLLPGKRRGRTALALGAPVSPRQALNRALSAMATVCGWVILFRVILAILRRWCLWLLPAPAQVALAGALELVGGCCALTEIPREGLRFLILSGLLAFGGLCVGMQTVSVTGSLGLGWYLPGKGLQTLFSLLLAQIALPFLYPEEAALPLPVSLLILAAICLVPRFFAKHEKSSGNSKALGV